MAEVRIVDEGVRSSLYASRAGALYRHYHDTDEWVGPLAQTLDAQGVARTSGNRRVDALVDDAFSECPAAKPPPPYLRRACAALVARRPRTVEVLAHACGVEASTAWGYAARAVELWPERACAPAARLVYPPLLAALRRLPCAERAGALRDVMQRLTADGGPLRGDVGWREVDRYAHLRLARVVLDAAEAAGVAIP
jgi:hypothetical protein